MKKDCTFITIAIGIGGFLLGMLAGALIFGDKKKLACKCGESDDSLGFDEDFFTGEENDEYDDESIAF